MATYNPGVPLIWGQCIDIELPNGDFARIDTTDRGNECGYEIKIEHLDSTGAFRAAIQVHPQ